MASRLSSGRRSKATKTPAERRHERAVADEALWQKIQPAIAARKSVSSIAEDYHVSRVRLSRIIKEHNPKYACIARNHIEKLQVAEQVETTVRDTKKKFPRANDCIIPECRAVYIQQHEGHRMCRECRARNRGWH